jgi:hypothetical protein
MGEFLFIGTGCRVAGAPTFIPGITPDKNHALVTLMVNRKTRAGKVVTDEITANFWGKNSSVAANYLGTGKQCDIRGRIQSYSQATGKVLPNQKAEIHRRIEVVVTRCELMADSRKVQEAELATNINALKAQGRLPVSINLSMDDLFSKKSTMVDFNPAVAVQTGNYGHAKVWSKDAGFWGNGVGQAAPVAVNAVPVGDPTAQIANLQTMIAKLQEGSGAVNVPPVEIAATQVVADPFDAGQ